MTRIVYREGGGLSHPNNGPLTTVKVKDEACPLSNLSLAPKDPRRRIFLVHSREVAFNKQAFREYCHKAGWEMPKVSKNSPPFDIEAWLADKARETFGTAAFADVTGFADRIGLQTNFFQLAKEKFCPKNIGSPTGEERAFNAIGFRKPGKRYYEFHGLI